MKKLTKKLEKQLSKVAEEVNKAVVYTYSPEVKDEALALYLYGHTPTYIGKKLGLDPGTITKWSQTGGWVAKRGELFQKAYQQSWAAVGNHAGIAQNLAQQFFNEQLKKKMESGEDLDWDEMSKLCNMVLSMQKISRTEDGKPTEITQSLSMREMKAEIKMILKEDPFQEFQEAIEVQSRKELAHDDTE